jgi:hypothetical protein
MTTDFSTSSILADFSTVVPVNQQVKSNSGPLASIFDFLGKVVQVAPSVAGAVADVERAKDGFQPTTGEGVKNATPVVGTPSPAAPTIAGVDRNTFVLGALAVATVAGLAFVATRS